MPSGRIGVNTGDRTPTADIYIQLFTGFAAFIAVCADGGAWTTTVKVIALAAFCGHLRTAADLDLRIIAASANAASISVAHGIDNTAEDTNGRFFLAARTAANACNGIVIVLNKCRSYRAVKDGDISRAIRATSTTDRCRLTIRFCGHLSVPDGNLA